MAHHLAVERDLHRLRQLLNREPQRRRERAVVVDLHLGNRQLRFQLQIHHSINGFDGLLHRLTDAAQFA